MNILRGKREGASEQEIMSYLIEGGTLSGFMLERLARARGADDAVKEVCKLYRLDAAAEAYAETHSIVWIEIALERKVMELGLRTLRTSVLSPGTIVGYLYLKENEIMNIRKIVRGKEFGTPPEKIRETIVLI
jgi:vacuolar-type H+-ATPase subunit C/Vma6